jgi:hypothetical protein
MLSTAIYVANVITHGVQIKDKLDGISLDHYPAFVDLCDSSDEDETIPISVQLSNFSPLDSIAFDVSL